MVITKAILDQAKEGMRAIAQSVRGTRNCYIYMNRDDPRRIEWMVEKGNTYYGGQSDEVYVYWDSGVYGFSFDESLFDLGEVFLGGK